MSKSEEESVEEVGEPVIKVLKDTDPEKSPFLANPTLALSGCKPRGQPSSYNQISIEISRIERNVLRKETNKKLDPVAEKLYEKMKTPDGKIQIKMREKTNYYLLSHLFAK